jgi:hypothetical protein
VDAVPRGEGVAIPDLEAGPWMLWRPQSQDLDLATAVRFEYDSAAREYRIVPDDAGPGPH